ncbi:unnamed protein product [Microthlaspi erraticum]|uniref:Myb-like domain-containing protein n=1 Tax=Microthlaspi erraticum TaxID=1685480 RepID=A0A6D2JYC4_9BRAS|nr:unnamed protein product [Microthlaspi erraticum]
MDLAATRGRAGSKFKPKFRPRLRKHTSVSTSQTLSNDANEKLSTQSSVANAVSENLEKQRCDDKETHDCSIQEEEDRLNMERCKTVQEGITPCGTCYLLYSVPLGNHTEKLQPKPRLHGNVIEEQNHSVHKDACEPRNEAVDTKANISADLQEDIFPRVPQETVPEMATGNSSREWEHEKRVDESASNNTAAGEDDCLVDEKSGRERNVRKSTRAAAERSRAAQKRDKPSGEPNRCSEEPQKKKKKKKFKHSTRRQKRTLEKELLEVPDEEIRFLPIKDLLRLVDYKEWLEEKKSRGQGSKAQESTSKASDNQYSQDDTEKFDYYEFKDEETSRVKPDSPVNYQTFSQRTARSRWSKQDTELFYEGIREFGSNLSMVQKLFPNISRQQMKLKYKLEERKHPFKLNDALASRPKHHTHHKNLIKKLQHEAAAREAKEEEAETAGEAAEAEAKTNDVPENKETERAGVAEPEVNESDGAEAESDQTSNGKDDDDYWDSYRSEM